jgi:hypothetical protein
MAPIVVLLIQFAGLFVVGVGIGLGAALGWKILNRK